MPSKRRKPPLVEQRLELQKVIADAFREQNRYYASFVLPNAAQARLQSWAPKNADKGVVKSLSLDEAEKLDRTTPTGAFEYGRAYVDHFSGLINRTRTQLKKVERELERTRAESARRAAAGRELQASIPGLFAERLGALRALVLDAREGSRTLSTPREEMA